MGRAWADLDPNLTIHALGDVHIGGNPSYRYDKITHDLASSQLAGLYNTRLQTGDLINTGIASEDATALAWLAQLPGPSTTLVCGNHEIYGVRTADQWAAAYGLADQNYTKDIGTWGRLIICGPDQSQASLGEVRLSTATLTWIGQQAAATSRYCMVACHASIYDTVGGNPVAVPTSTNSLFFVTSDTDQADSNDIVAVLAAHSNIVAWFSGHTHSAITLPRIGYSYNVGGRTIAAVNFSSPYSNGVAYDPTWPIRSMFVTFGGSYFDVRFRDHGAGRWIERFGQGYVRVPIG